MEDSLYEGNNSQRQNQDSQFCLGRIVGVSPERRVCTVKTFMGNRTTEDNHIPECQWLSLDGHPDGDESTIVPRVNSLCLVFFVAGEPFVFGFWMPQTSDGSAYNTDDEYTNKEVLGEGDKIYKTAAGNKIIIRASGEIEIHSTSTCRTIYMPGRNLINTLCRNFEHESDGGVIRWYNEESRGATLFQQIFRENFNAKNNGMVIEERGKVGGEVIFRTELGLAEDQYDLGQIYYTKTIKKNGETELFIREAGSQYGYYRKTETSGRTTINIGNRFKQTIEPTGEFSLNVNEKYNMFIKPTGEVGVTINGKASLGITPDGKIAIDSGTGKSKIVMDPSGKISVETTSAVSIKTEEITLDAGKKISLGKVAAEAIILGNSFLKILNKFIAIFNTHKHTSTLPTLPTTPTDTPMQAVVENVVLSKLSRTQKK